MYYCDLTFQSPAENLAFDEALLDACEDGLVGPVLRFWEPASAFVVIGYGNRVAQEVNLPACERLGVPVFRRCTGGGTVLQAPGCLNYTLILRMDSHPSLEGITGTNEYVMEANRACISALAGLAVERKGHTDLAIAGRKFCGNAQRRRRNFLIFHGCFILDCDLALMEQVLQMPSKQPDYRHGRAHTDFLTTLNVAGDDLKSALKAAWGAAEMLATVPLERMRSLVREKYSSTDWNLKM